MQYRALIFDLDGTATPDASDSRPSQAVIAAVGTAMKSFKVAAATGRSWAFAKPVIEALGLTDPCVVGGGSLIVSPKDEKIVWQALMEQEAVAGMLAVLRERPYRVAISSGLEQGAAMTPADIEATGSMNILYVIAVEPEEAEGLRAVLQACGPIAVAKAHSWGNPGRVDLHVTPLAATKEQGVRKLCELLGAKQEEVIGIGDGYNDAQLFNAVGYRVAMGNSVPELKVLADKIIGPIEEDGLATFLNQL